jgi:hypothetical protein
MVKKKLEDWLVCGRIIGQASGWDQSDTFAMTVYDLEPGPSYRGPKGDILITFETGTIESLDKKGYVKESMDILEAIKDCPRPHEVANHR